MSAKTTASSTARCWAAGTDGSPVSTISLRAMSVAISQLTGPAFSPPEDCNIAPKLLEVPRPGLPCRILGITRRLMGRLRRTRRHYRTRWEPAARAAASGTAGQAGLVVGVAGLAESKEYRRSLRPQLFVADEVVRSYPINANRTQVIQPHRLRLYAIGVADGLVWLRAGCTSQALRCGFHTVR